jgi:phosphoribosyl 1,2-cyclic phosphate phosphodiesterase
MIEDEGYCLVIDAGPDFRQQMLREKVKRLDAILLTHGHKDHTGGIDDIRSFNFLQRRSMPIYAQENVLNDIRREFSYVFHEDPYPGVPQLDLHPLSGDPFKTGPHQVIPIPVMHGDMPVLGFRIGDFSYVTDANRIPDASIELIRGSRVLVLNALQMKPHYSHYNLEGALEVIALLKPERAYLTHLGHRMGLHNAVSKLLPANVKLGWDGLQFSL